MITVDVSKYIDIDNKYIERTELVRDLSFIYFSSLDNNVWSEGTPGLIRGVKRVTNE